MPHELGRCQCHAGSPQHPPGCCPSCPVTFADEQDVVVAESNGTLAPEAANLVDADTVGADGGDLAALIDICAQTNIFQHPGKAAGRRTSPRVGRWLPLFLLERRLAGKGPPDKEWSSFWRVDAGFCRSCQVGAARQKHPLLCFLPGGRR